MKQPMQLKKLIEAIAWEYGKYGIDAPTIYALTDSSCHKKREYYTHDNHIYIVVWERPRNAASSKLCYVPDIKVLIAIAFSTA